MLSSQVCPACTPAPGAKLSSVHREKEVADGAVVCFPVWLFSEFAIEDSHLSHVWGISSAKFLHSFYFISLIFITAWLEGQDPGSTFPALEPGVSTRNDPALSSPVRTLPCSCPLWPLDGDSLPLRRHFSMSLWLAELRASLATPHFMVVVVNWGREGK